MPEIAEMVAVERVVDDFQLVTLGYGFFLGVAAGLLRSAINPWTWV